MYKIIVFIGIIGSLMTESMAASVRNTADAVSAYNYNYMYPYMNNQMRTDLNPGTTPTLSSNPIDVVVRTNRTAPARRVLPRSAQRSASTYAATAAGTPTAARAVTNRNTASGRRVLPRSAQQPTIQSARATRGNNYDTYVTRATAAPAVVTNNTETISSARCLADYTECMNGYCQRENTKYNRCYCSSKLAQIDSKYQSQIDTLIKQIIQLQNKNQWSAAEMDEYWMSVVGKYSNENSWTKLDTALDINWADTESRVRGQQAFAAGHSYCVQHLQGCYYMASNLRDAYRSEISRDCATYEESLQKIKNAAESIIGTYK